MSSNLLQTTNFYINMDNSQCRSIFAQNLGHAHIFRLTQTVGYAQLVSKITCYNEPMVPCALHTLAVWYLPHVNTQHLLQFLPWLRWLAANLSPRRPRFNPEMALRQIFHQVPWFSCHCYSSTFIHISPMPHNHSFLHFITNITQC